MTLAGQAPAGHTPGPWHVGGDIRVTNDRRIRRNVWGPAPAGMQSGEMVCQLATVDNARLIAAAPDLLEALEEVCDWITGCLAADDNSMPDADMLRETERIATKARAALSRATGSQP